MLHHLGHFGLQSISNDQVIPGGCPHQWRGLGGCWVADYNSHLFDLFLQCGESGLQIVSYTLDHLVLLLVNERLLVAIGIQLGFWCHFALAEILHLLFQFAKFALQKGVQLFHFGVRFYNFIGLVGHAFVDLGYFWL